ncbi:MAG: hypothetical protein ACYCQI_16880 [Gammaproteobacteria bacterium]
MGFFRNFHENTTFKTTGLATKILFQVMEQNIIKKYDQKPGVESANIPNSFIDFINKTILSHSERISKRKELVRVLAEVLKDIIDYEAFKRITKERQHKITLHLAAQLEDRANKYSASYIAEFYCRKPKDLYGWEWGYDWYRTSELRSDTGICWNWVQDAPNDIGVRYTKACFPEDLFMNKEVLTKLIKDALAELSIDRVTLLWNCGSTHKLFDNKSIDSLISDYVGPSHELHELQKPHP